jgi:AbrB family looped-hinge helix DNA binding protein
MLADKSVKREKSEWVLVSLDSKGRILVPKSVRQKIGIVAGDQLLLRAGNSGFLASKFLVRYSSEQAGHVICEGCDGDGCLVVGLVNKELCK